MAGHGIEITELHKYWVVRYHYNDVIMGEIASQVTSLTSVYSTVYSGVDQRKHQSSASLAFVWGIHRGPGNSPHKWSITRKMFPFGDAIIISRINIIDKIGKMMGKIIIVSYYKYNGKKLCCDGVFIWMSINRMWLCHKNSMELVLEWNVYDHDEWAPICIWLPRAPFINMV